MELMVSSSMKRGIKNSKRDVTRLHRGMAAQRMMITGAKAISKIKISLVKDLSKTW